MYGRERSLSLPALKSAIVWGVMSSCATPQLVGRLPGFRRTCADGGRGLLPAANFIPPLDQRATLSLVIRPVRATFRSYIRTFDLV